MSKESRALTKELDFLIGPTLLGVACNVRKRIHIDQWSMGGRTPNPDQMNAMRCVKESLDIIAEDDGYDTARQWLIGHNDRLGEVPVFAVRRGRYDDVRSAAQAFARDDVGY